MNFYVYILKSVNYPKTYVGLTENIQNRLTQHNQGNSHFTKRYLPWKLIYCEECENRLEARKREKYFKSSVGRRQIKKILEN